MISPYFGLGRVEYLQALSNRWGDFKVSWNFTTERGELGFTKRRSVLELWEEDYTNPKHSRLNKVMHRQAIPCEYFIEIDDKDTISSIKRHFCISECIRLGLEYCAYKSRKGYHISVLDKHNITTKESFIKLIGADQQMISNNATWSMEWTNHWKQKDFVILPVDISKNYTKILLGDFTTLSGTKSLNISTV